MGAHTMHTKRLAKYLTTGVTAAIVEFGLFLVLVHLAVPLIAANVISFGAGFATSFMLNKQWVFKARSGAFRQLALYGLLACINVFISSFVVFALTVHVGVYPAVAKVIAMGLIVSWNYIVFSRLIFTTKNTRTL